MPFRVDNICFERRPENVDAVEVSEDEALSVDATYRHRAYLRYLAGKRHYGDGGGFEPIVLPSFLFDFQLAIVEWALRQGRCAIFADCGLGKTPMQLVWAENVVRKTNRHVLIAAPLAVSHQIVAEAGKFGVSAVRSQDGKRPDPACVVVTNYERLGAFNPSDYAGLVCDESSILKSFSGSTRATITAFARCLAYRLLCTATAAPNDYTELGTSSEALGGLGYMDMLNRFFKNAQGNSTATNRGWGTEAKWRFKGHAETAFWRFVCSWARAIRRPSDLGFDDGRFVLPPLHEREHVVKTAQKRDGMLLTIPATCLQEEREERRLTIRERCEKVASLVTHDEQALVWCHLNDEGDMLADLIPGAEQVSGSDSDDDKEARLIAFAEGRLRVLVTKPKIGAWGLNLQNCAHVTFFPSHSYEQYYQGVRRCWRFGQTRPVVVDIVATEGELGVKDNLRRKAAQADRMFSALVAHMNEALGVRVERDYSTKVEVPAWLSQNR